MWRWDQAEPFGNNPADENPSGLGAFDLPLRLPGQYFDAETGLHYNYFRDYDPSLGRYAESDPIGLDGGLSTYTYASGAPVSAVDPDGLLVVFACRYLSQGVRQLSGLFYGRYQKHCFVQVTCPAEGINVVLSLIGESGVREPKRAKKYVNYKDDNPSAPTNTDWRPITPGAGDCRKCCKYEKEVLSKFNAFPSGWVGYDAMGSNSNSFAEMLVTSPSCKARLPYESIQDTPGLGFPAPR